MEPEQYSSRRCLEQQPDLLRSLQLPLLGGAGLELKPYPYYDTDRHVIDVDGMLDALRTATAGDAVLLHACCHNPSGLDPTDDDWRAIIDVIVERRLLPFIDMAYQGFERGVEEDALAVRLFANMLAGHVLLAVLVTRRYRLTWLGTVVAKRRLRELDRESVVGHSHDATVVQVQRAAHLKPVLLLLDGGPQLPDLGLGAQRDALLRPRILRPMHALSLKTAAPPESDDSD